MEDYENLPEENESPLGTAIVIVFAIFCFVMFFWGLMLIGSK